MIKDQVEFIKIDDTMNEVIEVKESWDLIIMYINYY